MEEAPLPGVAYEDGVLDGIWILEPGQGLERDGALPAVLLAVGLLFRGEFPEMLDLPHDPVAYERVSHVGLPSEEDVGPPVPPPPHCGVVFFYLEDLFLPVV